MTRMHRRLIFLLFVGVFIVLAPAVLLYANGWRWDWEHARFVRTGIIIFHLQGPKDARVLLDGNAPTALTENNGESRITNLLPGRYTVRWEHSGYLPREESVIVTGSRVSSLGTIALVRTTSSFLIYPNAPEHFSLSPSNEIAAWIQERARKPEEATTVDDSELVLLWLKNGNFRTRAIPLNASFRSDAPAIKNISWSPHSRRLAIVEQTKTEYRVVAYDVPSDQFGQVISRQGPIHWLFDDQTLANITTTSTIEFDSLSGKEKNPQKITFVKDLWYGTLGRLAIQEEGQRATISELSTNGKILNTSVLPLPGRFRPSVYSWPVLELNNAMVCVLGNQKNTWFLSQCFSGVLDIDATADRILITLPTQVLLISTTSETPQVVLNHTAYTSAKLSDGFPYIVAKRENDLYFEYFRTPLEKISLEDHPPILVEQWQAIRSIALESNGKRLYVVGKRGSDEGIFLRLLSD